MRYLAPIPSQFLDENGEPYYGGTVHVYVHGEMRHAEIYQNAQTDELAQNPFPLDSHGSWQAFVDADKTFDYIVMDSGGNVVARFPEITFPTGEGVPEVSVVSPDGSINVNEVVDETGKTFEIEVNRDILEPSYSEFSHDTVTGNGGAAVLDSFTLESDADADIYLTEGVLTFKKGLYHVSMNLVIGNSVESGAYYDIVVDFGGNELKKTWDGSFVHEESVELGMDVTADQDGHTVIPSIVELPEGMYCRVSRLDVHKVGGAGVGGSGAPIEHDGSLEGDGTHGNPLGVKDYSEIRTDLAEVIEGLDSHKTDPSAHQDIRDELERKEDKDNKVTSWGSTLSDEKYPSEKLVKDTIDNLPPGTAVKGDAESEYRTGNVNLTPANIGAYSKTESDERFKAVQTAVSDPTASGSGLSFIDSVSQDANGVISPHKKTVQDGTTSQKGVVQLNNAIDSTSTTEAATPKAVKDAYDDLNSKIVARAVFLSQQEWAAQSLLPGDPAKVYYVEDGTGEDAYTVYVWNSSTSAYVEVDESSIDLDGYWHDGPSTTGDGNVVTDITLGNDGVPQVEKGITALTQHQDISGKADKVSGATAGNFAGLDSSGNLTDSRKKAADFEPAFSVLPISKGGTNADDEKEAVYNLFDGNVLNDNNKPSGDSILMFRLGTPTSGNGYFLTRKVSLLWSYIKDQISSVLGLSESNGVKSYTGNAATATSATSATSATTAAGYTNDGAIATALADKQDTISTDTDSSAFDDNTAIATGFSSNKLHLNAASRLWNYIKGKILGWYDWTRVDSGTGRYAKICSIADPASGTSYTVDVLVTHMTSYYAVTGLVRITVSHGSSSVQASILASDSSFYAVDSSNPPKVYTYVDGNGKRTFVFDTASAYQTAQGFVFRAVGGFSDKWSFFGDVGCSNDAADLGSIGTKQDALDVPFVFATYAKTAGHAATATSADNATSATNAGYAYQAGNAATVNSHTVDKDVPSNAAFTDTTYSQISRGSGAGLAPGLPSGSGTSKYLREDGTWYTPPNDTYSAGDGLTLTEMNQFSVDNPFDPNGDYSSNTLKANYAVSAGSATSAGNYSSGGGIDSALQGKAPKLHIDTQGIYGLAKEGYYGHVKLEKGNLSGRTYSDGAAASVNHNHDGNYLKAPQSKTLQWGGTSVIGTYNGNNITLTMPANPFDPNGDYSSNTLKANSAVSADSAQYAVGASNYTTDGSIASRFNIINNDLSTINTFGLNGILGKILTFSGTAAAFDFDNAKTAGVHIFNLNTAVSGGPAAGHQVLIVLRNATDNRVWQISLAYGLLARKWNGSSWSSWKTILSAF